MGNNNQSQSFLQKGEGLRILSIKLNSPFDGKVQPFFDFIIDVIPLESQRSAKEILDKLTNQQEKVKSSRTKDFNQIVIENEQKKIQLKIVSTKYRNVRSIVIVPNRNWNGSKDLIGINYRKQKYDQAFDTYFPVSEIVINSPIHLAGVKEGQYLLGCFQFQYNNLNIFIQGLYDRFFDKQVPDKNVHLALYDILSDQVSIKPILLKRGWGGNGLLGCDFLQGQLYKFPHNLKQRRQKLLQQHQIKAQKQKIKFQLGECDGASKTLVEALKNKRNKKGKHMQIIKNMISIPLPEIPQPQRMRRQQQNQIAPNQNQQYGLQQQNARIQYLQKRVSHLEQTLSNIKYYLDVISSQQQNSQQKQVSNKVQAITQEQKPQIKAESSPKKQ